MSKNLRKTLSKNKVSQPKPPEAEKMNNDNAFTHSHTISNTEPSTYDIDPLNFFDKSQSDTQVNPLKFLDLISSSAQEKKEREKELEKEKEFKEQTGFKDLGQMNKNRLTMVQSSRMKPENKPMKLIDPQDALKDEAILKRFTKGEKVSEAKIIPGKIDKINLNEMDANQKQHMMERMSSARQNMSKIAFGRALINKTSEAIQEKAKVLEEKIKQNDQIVSSKYVINDSDVQRINDIPNYDDNINHIKPIKDIDIESLMKPNEPQQNLPKKETRSIADIILKRPAQAGKKKGATPVFDLDKKD